MLQWLANFSIKDNSFLTLRKFSLYLAYTAGLWATFHNHFNITSGAYKEVESHKRVGNIIVKNCGHFLLLLDMAKLAAETMMSTHVPLIWLHKIIKYYINFGFLSPSPPTCNFPHIEQKVQLLAIKLILIKAKFTKFMAHQNLKFKASTCINFLHTFFNGTNWKYNLKPQYLLTREKYPRFWVRSELHIV